MQTDELDICAGPPTWLARSQKIACTRSRCAAVHEPSWWRKWHSADSALTGEVYFGLKSSFAHVCEVRRWGEIAGQLDGPIIIGHLIIIITVVYIIRRTSQILSLQSTKTFAIVNIRYYRLSAQPYYEVTFIIKLKVQLICHAIITA